MTTTTNDDRLLFLRKFIRHGTQVASVAPSSRALARELCHFVDPSRPQTILELGAGSGAVTAVAAERMHRSSALFAVELDADFAALLRRRCPTARVIEADAVQLVAQLAALGVQRVDVVISGLPTPSLPPAVLGQVLAGIHTLAGDGSFSQLTVMPWVYQRFYQRRFRDVRFVPVWWNLPPGGVYHCRGVRDGVMG